jgi:hypothetical protein
MSRWHAATRMLVWRVLACCAGLTLTACSPTMGEPSKETRPSQGPGHGGSALQWVNDFADCMRGSGFAVTVDESVPTFLPDGNLPDDQIGAWDEAFDKCRKGLGPPPVEPLDPDQLPKLYQAAVAAKECLEGLGYAISDPPSLEAWVESYETAGGPWLPHKDLPRLSEEEWLRVNSECPQP